MLRITIASHGLYVLLPSAMDHMIAKYLPASIVGLRQIANDRGAADGLRYNDVDSVTELLAILAEYDGLTE